MMSENKKRNINEIFSKADRLNRLLNDIVEK